MSWREMWTRLWGVKPPPAPPTDMAQATAERLAAEEQLRRVRGRRPHVEQVTAALAHHDSHPDRFTELIEESFERRRR